MEEGAVLVQISRELFLEFVADRPRTLLMYLQTVSDGLVPCASIICKADRKGPVAMKGSGIMEYIRQQSLL